MQDAETEFGGGDALLRRQQIPAPGRLVIGLAAEAARIHHPGIGLRLGEPLLGRRDAPAQRLGVILRHVDAVREHQLEIVVGGALVDFGGAVIPAADVVMRVTAVQIGQAQLELRLGMPLLGGPAIPHDAVAQIAENALAAGKKQPEPILRLAVAGLGERCQHPRRGRIIFPRIGRERRPERARLG